MTAVLLQLNTALYYLTIDKLSFLCTKCRRSHILISNEFFSSGIKFCVSWNVTGQSYILVRKSGKSLRWWFELGGTCALGAVEWSRYALVPNSYSRNFNRIFRFNWFWLLHRMRRSHYKKCSGRKWAVRIWKSSLPGLWKTTLHRKYFTEIRFERAQYIFDLWGRKLWIQ